MVDLYRGRVTLRKLLALVRHLPIESACARVQGSPGFSMLELLVMENGMAPGGALNPRHPFNEAEREAEAGRKKRIGDRAAYYAAKREAQSLGVGTPGDNPADRPEEGGKP